MNSKVSAIKAIIEETASNEWMTSTNYETSKALIEDLLDVDWELACCTENMDRLTDCIEAIYYEEKRKGHSFSQYISWAYRAIAHLSKHFRQVDR